MTTHRTYTARVQRGIAYLDKHLPGWFDQISPPDLDLARGNSCVLGQVLGNFYSALSLLRLNDFQAQKLGFTIIGAIGTDPEFSTLTECWIDALRLLEENE